MLETAIVLLLAVGDAAPAGAEYIKGLKLLEEENYVEAATAFEEALRLVPAETPALKYRDPNGRHRHPYFPYYGLAEARLAQSRSADSPYIRRGHLQAAVRNFAVTEHPDGPGRLQEVRTQLEELEKFIVELEASTPPPEIAQLRGKVDRLCEEQKFEEAFREIEAAGNLFLRFERLKNETLTNVRNRQRAALASFDVILASRLDSISRTDPTYEAEIVLPLLKPAQVPPEVTKSPAPKFRWLEEFVALYGKELECVRTAPTLPPEELMPSAAAFDGLAGKALGIGLFGGFRASRNMGHSMRMARLRELATSADKPGSDLPGSADFQKAAADLLAASDADHAAVEKDLKERLDQTPDEDLQKYVEVDLPYQKRQIEAVRGKIKELTVAYDRRVRAGETGQAAEAGLFAPATLADPEACRGLLKPLNVLEAEAWFETLPAAVRARVLFARAVCEATAAFLDAEPSYRVAERCRGDVIKAYALDPKVDARWREAGRLSPRISKVFEQMRR